MNYDVIHECTVLCNNVKQLVCYGILIKKDMNEGILMIAIVVHQESQQC